MTSILSSIRDQQRAVKTNASLSALHAAHSSYRRDPAAAIRRLEGLDLAEVPADLLHQITGVRMAACARLCRAGRL